MEAYSLTTASEDRLGDDFLLMLREQRAQAESFLREQRSQLEQLEHDLLTVVQALSAELDQEQDETVAERRTWREKAIGLERQSSELARLKQELTAQQEHWQTLQQLTADQQQLLFDRLAERDSYLQNRSAELDQREQALEQLAAGLQEAEHQMQALRSAAEDAEQAAREERQSIERQKLRLQQRETRLDEAIQQAEDHDAETRRQRRRLANQFRLQREEMRQLRATIEDEQTARRQELDRWQAELEESAAASGDHTAQVAALHKERDDLRRQVACGEHELTELNDRLAALADQVQQLSAVNAELKMQEESTVLATLRDRISHLEAENQRLTAAVAAGSRLQETDELLDGLTQEKNDLIQKLLTAEERITALERDLSTGGNEAEKLADSKRRLELAIEDNRALKRRNAELEEKLSSGGGKTRDTEAGFDWESQKQRLIAALESDFDASDPKQQTERLTAEGTIRITDEIVSRKEREIAELKQLLSDQSANVGNLAVGANAVQEVLNSDELIRQERESLAKIKAEMREKQRQAEVEISLERAKLARMRAEFEEKLSAIEMDRAKHGDKGPDSSEAPPRGRWLARLGLKDDEDHK